MKDMEEEMNEVFKDWGEIISRDLEKKLFKQKISVMEDEIERYKHNWKAILKENRDLRRKILEQEKTIIDKEVTMTEKQGELVFEYMKWESFKWPACTHIFTSHDMIVAMNKMNESKDWHKFVDFVMTTKKPNFLSSAKLIIWIMQSKRFFQLMGEWLELIENEMNNTTHHHETGREE